MLASVPFVVVLPLLVAILLNRKFPAFEPFFRAMLFAPFVLGIAVIGVLFNYLLDTDDSTLVNYLLGFVGIGPIGWVPDGVRAVLS